MNVVRHAQARTCTIRVQAEPGALVMAIADDGVGLPADYRPGVGLVSMRERAEELGGTLEIAVAGGTRVTATLPLPAGEPRGEA
jgi:signal transduction histidine kinase